MRRWYASCWRECSLSLVARKLARNTWKQRHMIKSVTHWLKILMKIKLRKDEGAHISLSHLIVTRGRIKWEATRNKRGTLEGLMEVIVTRHLGLRKPFCTFYNRRLYLIFSIFSWCKIKEKCVGNSIMHHRPNWSDCDFVTFIR